MKEDTQKVVKCKNDTCGQHFMHTKEDTKCPFCHTEYTEINTFTEKETKKKVDTKKIKKESFKIWNES